MFSADSILGRNFGILAASMDGLAKRQSVHAENVANINTPGYQARTVDFESSLRSAMNDHGPASGPMGASGAFLPASVGDAATGGQLSSDFAVTKRKGQMGSGNLVDRTTEVSAMVNDNIRFRVISQQVTNRLSALKGVIAEMSRG